MDRAGGVAAGEAQGLGPLTEATFVGDIDLDSALTELAPQGPYRRARLLVWMHARPLGEIDVAMPDGRLSPSALTEAVEAELGAHIATHLAADREARREARPGQPGGDTEVHPCQAARDNVRSGHVPATVVIATRDRTESLLRCLRSIAAQDYGDFDVIVVDSAPSTDDTRLAIGSHDWRFPVRYLRADRPGSAFARNVAIPEIRGDIVAFADDDIEADSHWLSALVEAFDDDDVACVTGLILPAELETRAQLLLEQYGGFSRGFTSARYRLSTKGDRLFPFAAGRFGSGANMAFRSDWIRGRGGFDVATGAGTVARGGEDLLAFLDTILDRRTLVYQPAAVVRHYHRREMSGLQRQAFGYGVGLGAYVTAAIWSRPSLLPRMLVRSVAAARYLVSADSAKNRGKSRGFPPSLTWRERAGVVVGPFAYALSRRRTRDLRTGTSVIGQAVR